MSMAQEQEGQVLDPPLTYRTSITNTFTHLFSLRQGCNLHAKNKNAIILQSVQKSLTNLNNLNTLTLMNY